VVGALAPDDLERVGELLDRLIDRRAAVAEGGPLEADVSEFNGAEGHDGPSFPVRSG
jgi:hypothetical protein